MLMYDGYTFIREKSGINDKIIWRCSEWSKTKYKGRCHTDLEEVKFHFHNHNHIADPINMEAIIIKNKKSKNIP